MGRVEARAPSRLRGGRRAAFASAAANAEFLDSEMGTSDAATEAAP